jgi:glycosyltransferase involved in cell wall biosynthesis
MLFCCRFRSGTRNDGGLQKAGALSMRVLFVHLPNDLYGAGRSLIRIVRRSVTAGDTVHVMLPPGGPLTDICRDLGAVVHESPYLAGISRSGVSVNGMLRLARDICFSTPTVASLARRINADIIHSNSSILLSGALGATLAGKTHSWHLRENYSEFPRLWKLHQRLMLALSKRVFCNSLLTARQFGSPFPEKVSVVYNGFEPGDISPISLDQAIALRRDYSLSDKVVAGVVGRIKLNRKGQDVFIKAAAEIADAFPNAHFVCIGSCWPGNEDHVDRLIQMASEAGLGDRFRLLGQIDDLSTIYALLDLLVMPSVIPEAFGNVVLESMAARLPVIASSNGGGAEQIVDGETGFIVSPGDHKGLAKAMGTLLGDAELRKRMGAAGYRRFETKFSFDVNFAAFRQDLENMIAS